MTHVSEKQCVFGTAQGHDGADGGPRLGEEGPRDRRGKLRAGCGSVPGAPASSMEKPDQQRRNSFSN